MGMVSEAFFLNKYIPINACILFKYVLYDVIWWYIVAQFYPTNVKKHKILHVF